MDGSQVLFLCIWSSNKQEEIRIFLNMRFYLNNRNSKQQHLLSMHLSLNIRNYQILLKN